MPMDQQSQTRRRIPPAALETFAYSTVARYRADELPLERRHEILATLDRYQ